MPRDRGEGWKQRDKQGKGEEKNIEGVCLQKWKHPEQYVRAMTSKALKYC